MMTILKKIKKILDRKIAFGNLDLGSLIAVKIVC